MELILTSFGLSHLQRRHLDNPDIFYRMPPVSLSIANHRFMPDWPVLLLCDRVVLDTESFQRLAQGEYYRGYENVAEVMQALYDEGFVRLADFDSVITANRGLLERMLKRDLRRLDDWVEPLKESAKTWEDYVQSMDGLIGRDFLASRRPDMSLRGFHGLLDRFERHMAGYLHDLDGASAHVSLRHHMLQEALESSRKRRRAEYRAALREELTEYLAYVNANLVVSQALDTGFHDWYDFRPFYYEKFLGIGQEGFPAQARVDKVRQLFELSFPELTFWRTGSIVRALKDKRIADLRRLVDDAVTEGTQFDQQFANRTLLQVLDVEHRIDRVRNIVSYATLPIAFVPLVGTPVQKAVEEVATRVASRVAKSEVRWFYLISELAGN